jgi:hypothetical protein
VNFQVTSAASIRAESETLARRTVYIELAGCRSPFACRDFRRPAFDGICEGTYAVMREDAERAIDWVIEAHCPICAVALRIHDQRACCPCCGDSYVARSNHLDVMKCPIHGRECAHWAAFWNGRESA